MVPSNALWSLILITLTAVDASPVGRSAGKGTLSFATNINKRGTLNIVEQDRARARALKQAGQLGKRACSASFSITNAVLGYTAEVGVGTPPTYYTVIVDTGSSITWVGANKSYAQTSTSQDTGETVNITYGSGSMFGEEWIDTVTLSPDLVIQGQSIGVASLTTDFEGVDGILGVGPTNLTRGKVNNTDTVPTVSDNLFSQGTISEEVLGVYFIPAGETSKSGELTFGGYDELATVGPVAYVPLTTTSPASKYWGIDQSISYGNTSILSSTAGIVDTGTTLIYIPSDAFQAYQSMTGATLDSATGLLSITSDQYANLLSLWFTIGETPHELTPNAQIWPRSLNSVINGTSDAIYLVVNDIGTLSGAGFDFINGYSFLERYYSVYDTGNQRVGFAPTAYTFSESN